MQNFEYYNPVHLVFGKGTIGRLAELVPAEAKVLLLYGGGSIKKNGVYDQVLAALDGFSMVEFPGIEPNPTYETCMKAVEVIREQGCDFLLAVGGGSVIDGAKFIAAAATYTGGDPWDLLVGAEVGDPLPLGAVLTLPATGTEMNGNSVISRRETSEKMVLSDPSLLPLFSILDPAVTITLPERQTVNGVVDTFVHVMEQYMTVGSDAPLQDRFSEGIVSTLVEIGPELLQRPDDYELRANMMWCATTGLNGLIACGVDQDWSTHMIGHELTAFYGLDHAVTLAIVLPRLWRYTRSYKEPKLAQFARRVWGIDTADDVTAATEAIERTEAFFRSLGVKTRLAEHGIEAAEAAERIFARFAERGCVLGERGLVDAELTRKIVSEC